MRLSSLIKKIGSGIVLILLMSMISVAVHAESVDADDSTIDRVQLVNQQINLLKNRLSEGQHELAGLQKQHDNEISQLTLEKANKSLLEKIGLDISVASTNLDSVTIELTDSQQAINWLEKNIEEIQNQLNILGMFGLKVAKTEMTNPQQLRSDLNYQQKLLALEKDRVKVLESLQNVATNILQLKKDKYARLSALLKSRKLLSIKQQQVKDELAFQQQQNNWLQQLNVLYARLAKTDPTKSKVAYTALERDIFYANENANFAYTQSLIARYKDQSEQIKLAILKSNSISLLNEISDQIQVLTKQVNRLDGVVNSRISLLDKHITSLSQRKTSLQGVEPYLNRLMQLEKQYKNSDQTLMTLNTTVATFRTTLDHALQTELSSRQGFPTFGAKMWLDLGKELLLVPTLTFQVVKSLSSEIIKSYQATSTLAWTLFALVECLVIMVFSFLHKMLTLVLLRPSKWRDQINAKWLSLEWLHRHFIDVVVIANIIGVLAFFDISMQNYIFIFYLSVVWLVFKSITTLARLCLVETANKSVRDVRLYRWLKWAILVSGVVTALTVFVHQLPLIYEVTTLFDRLFLLQLMIVSLFMLRFSEVIPNLILARVNTEHRYLQKSIRLFGVLVPLLMFGNSVIGLFGFMNLVLTISWYEGVFLFVLVGYLILRGLLSDGMEQLSRLMIQYATNGWLWTEAFLKPIDKVLRISLFFMAWAVLFLLYGWDKQSPIVERLTGLLHYQLVNALHTTITPINIIELVLVISIFYWTAKWTREFVYRLLLSRTKDMGIRNSIAILSQYSVVVLGVFICLRVLGIDLSALTMVASMFAFGVGLGLRDLVNNFACGFLILLERPLRVGDIVNVNDIEGEVTHIGGRAVTVRTWDYMELVVPNTEIFNKSFTNWTAKDNTVRTLVYVKISRYDNPHEIKTIIKDVLHAHKEVLKDPAPEVYLKEMNDNVMNIELRYFVNIRQVKSRTSVTSSVLMAIWDEFAKHGIKPPYPQHEVFLRSNMMDKPVIELLESKENT